MADASHLLSRLLKAGTEDEVQAILDAEGLAADETKWTPYGDNESFYGVVENQQAHPIPALVEKITNGIDAILEKKVLEDGIDIRSKDAPGSVREALDRYFPPAPQLGRGRCPEAAGARAPDRRVWAASRHLAPSTTLAEI